MNKKHHKNNLKIRIYEIEKLLDKISRRMKRKCICEVKSLLKGWDGWWANKKERLMPYKSKKQKMAYKASGGWKKSKPTGKSKSYTKTKK